MRFSVQLCFQQSPFSKWAALLNVNGCHNVQYLMDGFKKLLGCFKGHISWVFRGRMGWFNRADVKTVISVHQSITITFIIFILNKFIQHQNVRDRGDKIVIWMITRLPVMFAIKNVFDAMKRGQRDTRCIVLWIHVSMLIQLESEKALRLQYIYEPFLWASLFFCSVCFYHSLFETELLKLSSH